MTCSVGQPVDLSRPLVTHRAIHEIHLHHEDGSELHDACAVERGALSREDVHFSMDPYNLHVYRGPDQRRAGDLILGVNFWRIVWGRPVDRMPASVNPKHAPGRNTHALAICVSGDYHGAPLPLYALDRLVEVCVWACRSLSLGPEHIYGHGELMPPKYTVCPGYSVAEVRRRVAIGLDAA